MSASWFRALLYKLMCVTSAGLLAAFGTAGCKDATSPPAPVAAATSAPAFAAPAEVTPASYQAAKYDPIHFKPAIEQATDQQCLACHAEVLKPSVRKASPAGLEAAAAKAWYQRISTYEGEQDTLHRRHLETPYAKQVMNLRCTTCHQGSDPRDQAPGSSATAQADLTLRKTVKPEATCLMCHGQMNWPVMGLPGPWAEFKEPFQNNCVVACHTVQRTVRHQVNYLNAQAIEELAAKTDGGDVCFGCHGGRAWYRVAYPYPRHPWPDMPDDVPEWAKNRPTKSEARFIAVANPAGEKQ
ncbi:MAG: hypothetical protein LBE78_08270 [Burkholderiaceae bacterium]|nr:hypothetical protein [Burkholderiaceae bacterium]